jgi:hypothetical protein
MMPSKLHLWMVAICAVTALASAAPAATGLPATLERKAKVAFADIAKAKAALKAGNTRTSQSYLAKSEALLKTVLNNAPSSAGTTAASTPGSAQQGSGGSAVSQAESEIAKLDPSLAAKVGASNENAATESADGTTAAAGQPSTGPTVSGTIARIESAYQKVTLARTLLKAGNASKAKSTLDAIPSSPLGVLKSASGL